MNIIIDQRTNEHHITDHIKLILLLTSQYGKFDHNTNISWPRFFWLISLNLSYLYRYITRFRVQFDVISTSKFFKDDKIARARRESAICSQLKIYKNLIYLIFIGK